MRAVPGGRHQNRETDMKPTTTASSLFVVMAATLACAGVAISQPASAETNFKGKRINVIIGSSPGGGTDGTTRLVGRFFEKYLPGKPSMAYRNMPAGHGVKALNYFTAEAKKDGTYWLGGSSSYVDPNNLRKDVVKYDPLRFELIGGVARGGSVVSVRKAKIPNLTDASKPPVVVGMVDGSRSWGQMMLWGRDKLDWNVKFVIGYPGAPSLMLAARRGEVDAFGTSTEALLRDLQKKSELDPFVQIGEQSEGKVTPRASFPDVPVLALVLGDKLQGDAREAFNFWVKTNQIDKWYALPPGADNEALETYRAAYAKVVKDPEFIKFGKHQFGDDFAPQTAQDVRELFEATVAPKPEILAYMSQMAERHGLPAKPLSSKELAKLAKERGLLMKANTRLDEVKNGGRELVFKAEGENHMVDISGSRTAVMISGKKTKRGNLKPGMACEISYAGDGSEAVSVTCD